ncbi:SemiSWEET transporter [Brachymonas sp. G13]|uniref:SemiSWEET transporter n=1 Tax=Brachymonas wangyanguii TaxID=3130163 RepID=UPI00307E89D4
MDRDATGHALMADLGTLAGYAAATLTTISFVPQALHSWRTRDVAGISLGMYSLFTLGVALWLAYGLWLHSWPMVIANSITLLLASMILDLKIRYRHGKPPTFGDR